MSKKVRVGVIGCGQWGPNQIRTFFFNPESEVKRVCDMDESRLTAMQSMYSQVETTTNSENITRGDDIDAVIITTPVFTHFEIAQDALSHGKDVLCEKPLTLSTKESQELIDLADKNQCVLMVGHVFLFNPGIIKLKELMDSKECGQNYYLHAKRTNLGPVRQDVNAVYDLAAHDISVFNYLLNATPEVISATGQCYLRPGIEDIAFVTLQYPNQVLAHVHVSWLDPKKVRQLTVVGDKKMMTWDDLSSTGSVEIFSKHIERSQNYKDYGEFQLLAKDGEVLIPSIKNEEPLKKQAEHFIDCVQSRKKPLADGQNGLDVVRTLQEITALLEKSRVKLAA